MSKRWEMALGVAIAAIGVFLLVLIIPREVKVVSSEANEISPAFFPRIVGWGFILLGLAHALGAAITKSTPSGDAIPLPSGTPRAGTVRAFTTFGIGLGYLVLLPGIGFLAASAIAMAALVLYFGEGPIWRAPLVTVPFSWFVERVFSTLLQVPLPRAGWFE